MDGWSPGPNARLYTHHRQPGAGQTLCCRTTTRRCLINVCKSCLFVVLIVTVIINITFIMQTNRKLNAYSGATEAKPAHATRVTASVEDKDDHEHIDRPSSLLIQVDAWKSEVVITANGKEVLRSDPEPEADRGIHVLVLNQATGAVMAKRVFDTYVSNEDKALVLFLKMISPNRIIVFAIKDEGTFQLGEDARLYLTEMGSDHISKLQWRDVWVFVTTKDGDEAVAEKSTKAADLAIWGEPISLVINSFSPDEALAEKSTKAADLASWGEPISLAVNVTLSREQECPGWPAGEATLRRREFCSNVEGYGDVCSCDKPSPIDFPNLPLESGEFLDVPIAVIASNRPHYLFRMLKTLVQTPGVVVNKITVFIDGFYDEPLMVTRLLNLKGIQHAPHGQKNARISQHYRASLTASFQRFPEADYIIIIEEDLDVSPDFFNYFKQTMPLLEDETLYCISAWNDQGYEHSCQDPSLLYRIETMPGLGWMMKKTLFMKELEPQWPSVDKQWDWDMWMRHDMIRKSRECVIPDISRTYHFGSKGLNMNPYFQELYFVRHKIQAEPHVKLKDIDKLKSEQYEELMENLIQGAMVLNHTRDPCATDFIPKTQHDTYVMYIQMKTETNFETWKSLAKCYKLWDLDVRGFHKSMWRQFHEGKHLIIVGDPASPYSKFKPESIQPIYLPEKKKETKET